MQWYLCNMTLRENTNILCKLYADRIKECDIVRKRINNYVARHHISTATDIEQIMHVKAKKLKIILIPILHSLFRFIIIQHYGGMIITITPIFLWF
jgi:hypothetical protein